MYTIDDIDVYIATHNRADYLKEMLDCLVKQTVKPSVITVLDNESTDNTQEIVEQYKDKGIQYIKTYTRPGNFLKAQELAQKEFCVIFHDDNLIHPQFFERILNGLNIIPNLAGISCSYSLFKDTINLKKKNPLDCNLGLNKSFLIYENWFDFCNYNIQAETFPWPKISPGSPALIYKTEILKNRVDMTSVYGKADDIYLAKQILENGNFAILTSDNALLIRQHDNRDLVRDDNNLTFEQCLNWVKIYTQELNKHECGDLWTKFWEMVYLMYPALSRKSVFKECSINKFCKYLIDNNYISVEGINYYKKFKAVCDSDILYYVLSKNIPFIQKIFSIKNESIHGFKKRKVINFFGRKFVITNLHVKR